MPNSSSAAEAMNNELARPCGHPLPSDPGYAGGFAEASGRGAGGEGSFSVEVHGPNARAHDVQVKATHEPRGKSGKRKAESGNDRSRPPARARPRSFVEEN